MHARSTTFQSNPTSIDAGIAFCRDEVMPVITTIDGCIGLSLIVDRSSGRCIATSAWQSLETMRASDAQLTPVRSRVGEIFGGRPQVEEWEISSLHRDHRSTEGACAQGTWLQGDPDRIHDEFRRILPILDGWEGFCSSSLLVNRETGHGVVTTTWDSPAALEASRERANELLTDASEQAGASIHEVCEFELALAHLRVPELV